MNNPKIYIQMIGDFVQSLDVFDVLDKIDGYIIYVGRYEDEAIFDLSYSDKTWRFTVKVRDYCKQSMMLFVKKALFKLEVLKGE